MKLWTAITLSLFLSPAWADWQLDNDHSVVNFVSVKKAQVAEAHRFERLNGALTDAGKATLCIDLTSVNTGIEIRDQRMQNLLFNVADNPQACVATTLDSKAFEAMTPGQMQALTITGELTLNGHTRPLTTDVQVAMTSATTLLVTTVRPIIVNAGDFGLSPGLASLAQIAQLPSITEQVPVSFSLSYRRQ